MHFTKSVSVIIPNYNGRNLLDKYLPFTIAAVQNSKTVFEIIIIDDCSTDDSVIFIKENYPQIILSINYQNKGFSYTCNQGLKLVKHELVLFLNSDVKLTSDYFENQWKYFELQDTFGVMGCIINSKNAKFEDTARYLKLTGLRMDASSFFHSSDKSFYTPTAYLSGANALINTQKIKLLGGFDEIFSPFYCEDFDLSLRAWRMGWNCYYEHASVCYHEVSASTKKYKTPGHIKSIYYRNKFFAHAIHLNGISLFLWHIRLFFIDFLPKLITGKFWIANSYFSFYRHTNEVKTSRNKIIDLMTQNRSNYTIRDVIRKIKKMLAKKQINWL